MNKLKRTLALTLVLCMLCSFLPAGALASEMTADDSAALESNEAVIQATSALTPEEPNRPADSSTTNQPFPSGTAGSTYFRIPAITTLSNGNLVAAADARWNDIYDKGNIDTLVSVSKDNGANWNYTFANYIDDGGNTFNISAATFIDPAMAVKTVNGVETIYMVTDLFPGQASGSTMCIHAALYGTGMSEDGHLLVSSTTDNNLSAMDHYVGDFDSNNMATLYTSAGADSGYDVDAWFNVYNSNGEHLGNLFTYGDTGFYVYQTSYLVLTKSTDGGKTWSAPTLLNHQVKSSSEKFYGVGPASGIVTSDGTIMFTAYTFTSSDGKTSTFYSKDNGVTWKRGTDLDSTSSEAALAEGNNGVVYLFNRYGQVCYTSDYGESWTYLSSVGYATGCEVSALTYSRPIDGKKAILVCGPTSGRYGGKIFVGLINDDNSINWKYQYAVTDASAPFQYSSMTELADGSIGLLYENTVNTTAGVIYENISIETILGEDAVIGTLEKTISLTVGETKKFTLDEVVDSGSHTSDAADITWTKVDTTVSVPAAQTLANSTYGEKTVPLNDCLYTLVKPNEWLYLTADVNGTTVYVNPHAQNAGGANEPGYPNRTESGYGEEYVTFANSTYTNGAITLTGDTGSLHFHPSSSDGNYLYWNQCSGICSDDHDMLIYKVSDTGSDTVLGGYYEQVTDAANLKTNEKYLIVAKTDDGGYYAMYPSLSTVTRYDQIAKITGGYTDVTTSETTVEIKANAEGSTSVEIGSTKYTINVSNSLTKVDVKLNVGDSKEFTESSGAYSSATTEPDADVVEMELVPNTAEATIEIGEAVNPVTAGKYVIYTYLGAYVTNKADGNYIDLSTTEQTIWNVAVADSTAGTYYITDSDGNYLYVDNGTAGVIATQTAVKLVHGTSTDDPGQSGFFIQNAGGNYNLNNSGGTDNAYGKSGANGSWSRWQFKPCTETPGTASTTVTFTGVASGTTTAVVGNTQYNITVASKYDAEIDVTLMVGESKTLTNDTGVYEDVDDSKLNTSIATVEITGSNTTTEKNLSEKVTAIESGKTYVLYNKSASKLMNNQWADASVGNGGTNGLALSSAKNNFQDNDCWTITVTDGGYYVQDINGKYLTIARGSAGVSDSPVVASLAYDGTDWTIGVNGEYANNYGEAGSAVAGWSDINDTCSQWEIYEVVTSVTSASTEITFKGVATGTTTAVVGNTLYNITVTPASEEPFEKEENVMLLVGQNKTHTDPTGNYEASYTGEGLDENIATVTVKGTTVEGSTTVTPVTTLTTDDTFYIQVSEGVYRTANGGTTTNLAEAELWTVKAGAGSYGRLMNEAGDYLIVDNGALTSQTAGNTYFNFDGYTYEIYYQTATVNITVGVPLKINVTEAKDVTDITFTGNSEGTTSVIVGKTRYNITVVSAYDCVTSENSPFVVGGDFIGSVTNDAKNEGMDYLTKLTMSSVMTKENLGGGSGVGYQVDLSSKFADAESISWSIADENIARIEVGADGKSVYVTAADANTTGTTYLSCTIDGQTYTIPVVIIKTTDVTSNSNWKYNSLHIAEITRTDVWYSWNCSGNKNQFVKAVEGEAIWTVFNKAEKFCINFYAAPDARHALTFMSATNSEGQYLTLADKNNPKNCDFYTKDGAGYRERKNNGFTDDQVANDIQAALDLGCDGAQGFSRSNTDPNAVNCNLTFISDPMPELAKTVNGILPITRLQKDFRRYYDGMVATVGEYVYFELTVTLGRPDVWKPVTDANGNAVKDDAGNVIISTDENGNPYGSIAYDTADLIDTALEGAYFYTKEDDRADEDNPDVLDGVISTESRQVQVQDITDALNAAWAADETVRTLSYYVIYEIQSEDIPKFLIENTATLEWDYDSHYSSGALDADAAADATITVVGTPMDNVVIDFGQKVVYTGLTYTHLKYVNLGTFDSAYGTYTVEGVGAVQDDGIGNKYYNEYKITYTPEAILQSPDTIQLMGTYTDVETMKEITKVINGFVVYPATTVYYEEGFLLDNNNGWNDDSAKVATTEQTFELLGLSQYNDNGLFTGFVSDQKHNYGFDPIYDGVGNDDVAASSISANTVGASTEFTFTGTGFELFADCTEDSGYIQVIVNDAAGKTVKMFMVNTVVKGGSTGATSGQTGSMEDLPIVSLKDLEHGSYTVKLIKVMNDNKTVTIDGVRITNTYNNSIVYAIDNEETPAFYQLRDYVISAIGIDAETVEDYSDLTGMAQQVYNDLISKPNVDSNAPTALITDVNTLYGNSSTIQDLLVNGPKNELYLWEGQTLTFKLYTARIMQIGMKAPNGKTNYTITITPESGSETTNNGSIASTVDMFYTLNNDPAAPQEYLVSITNEGNDATEENEILSITDLKLAYDPSATVQPLTLADVTTVLRAAGYHTNSVPETPVKPAVPFADVVVNDFYYDAVAWAVSEGITTGISDTHFGPLVFCNRAQAVTFLWRAAGSPEPTGTKHQFVDVPAGSFYEKAVLWALENGITTGTDSSHFSPMLNCNRATVVTFLYRAFHSPAVGSTENPFSDVPADDWFTAPILWAVEQKITTGLGDGTFGVTDICNRAQIVTFLYRAYN